MEQNTIGAASIMSTPNDDNTATEQMGAPNNNNAVTKQMAAPKEVTKNLITHWLWMFLFFNGINYAVTSFVFRLFDPPAPIQAIAPAALLVLIIFHTWRLSSQFTFRDKYIVREDVRVVMRALSIFTAILCAITVAYNVYRLNYSLEAIDTAKTTSYELKMVERKLAAEGTAEDIDAYYQQKADAIAEVKSELIILVMATMAMVVIGFIGALPFEKKLISKHVPKDNSSTTFPNSPMQPTPPATPTTPVSPAPPVAQTPPISSTPPISQTPPISSTPPISQTPPTPPASPTSGNPSF